MPALTPITVIKRSANGVETFRYSGIILRQEPGLVILEARFNRSDLELMGTVLRQGDRFVETFYTDRWYNIFEIYDRDDGSFKGWYCNVGRPAQIADGTVSYIDLALDLWVSPVGKQTVLDEDEFAALGINTKDRKRAFKALAELKEVFQTKRPPK